MGSLRIIKRALRCKNLLPLSHQSLSQICTTSHLNHFTLENKPQNHINDMLLPSKRAYKNARKLRNYDNSKLTDNLYYRLIKDLIKLPSNIKHHLKTRRF
ncbi:hypothetical protein GQ261_02030 [Campylobacter upsaliensis]|nr:hypothetical protein [Campylobacter upsaliensis]